MLKEKKQVGSRKNSKGFAKLVSEFGSATAITISIVKQLNKIILTHFK